MLLAKRFSQPRDWQSAGIAAIVILIGVVVLLSLSRLAPNNEGAPLFLRWISGD